jgi:peptidoglycan hydrolase-like protein with peptidoglycan-binding domain
MKKVWVGAMALFALALVPAAMASPVTASAHQSAWAHHTAMKKGKWSSAAHKAWVMKVQHALNMHGAHLKVDGNWGPMTKKALVAFQKSHGLKASGHMDKATLAKLGLAHHAMMKPAKQ